MDDALVELEGVDKIFRLGEVEVAALREVTLTLPGGEFIVFVGPSGSGKTTLLNLIGGLDKPTRGRIVVAGHDLGRMREGALTAYRRDLIGFVFQFFNLVPTLTARENVELVAELASDPLEANQVLEEVGLADRVDHFPAALSGGEQQRVAIARSLVKRPALILADEPTGNLDYLTAIKVLEVMREISRAVARGVILVTHNTEITRMADRVVRLNSGRVAEVTENPSPAHPRDLRW